MEVSSVDTNLSGLLLMLGNLNVVWFIVFLPGFSSSVYLLPYLILNYVRSIP